MVIKELFNDDDEQPIENHIRIDTAYEKKLNTAKDKEELKRLSKKVKEGLDDDDDDESSDEEEDSDAELLSRDVDAKVLETISRIKLKDPSIYNRDQVFFTDNDFTNDNTKENITPIKQSSTLNTKPLTFTKFMSTALKHEGPDAIVKEEERIESLAAAVGDGKLNYGVNTTSYEAEQQALRKAFLTAAEKHTEEDDFLVTVEKSEEEQRREEESFQAFLRAKAQSKGGDESKLLSQFLQSDETLNENDRFLRDYILLEGWKESNKMPQGNLTNNHAQQDEEDNKIVEATDMFEAAYNFRFEEDADIKIEGHARKVFDSVRQKDDRRRQRRLERAQRKQQEKEEQVTELQRLKKLKQNEILERLRIIQKVAGIKTSIDTSAISLDTEFNPETHDTEMQAILGDDYGEQEEENVEELLTTTPDELGDTRPEIPISSKQRKKLEKIAKKLKKHAAIEDDGSAYAPILDDETEYSENNQYVDDTEGTTTHEATNPEAETVDEENMEGEPMWYLCDGCHLGIREGAKRYDCVTCENFTFCTKCFRSTRHPHQLLRRRVAVGCKPPPEFMDTSQSRIDTPIETHPAHSMSPEDQALFDSIMEEYYALDYEDLIGGMPVRFKYRKVAADDCGMSIHDILSKDDKDLNSIVPLKRLAPYRGDKIKSMRASARDFQFKRKKQKVEHETESQQQQSLSNHQENNKYHHHKKSLPSSNSNETKTFKSNGRREANNNCNNTTLTGKQKLKKLKSAPDLPGDRLAAYGLTK